MRSRVTFLHHPVHPMLVMIPVAFFPLLLILDAIGIYAGDADGLWLAGFLATAIAGVVTVVALVPGIMDLSAIRDGTQAHRVGVQHAVVGFLILALYAVAMYLRWPMGAAPRLPWGVLALDAIGTIAVSVQGWLGGELVYRHHVGVNAPTEGGDAVEMVEGPSIHVPPSPPADRGGHR